VIDLKAARQEPDRYRAALDRRGAAADFDALLAVDARWRELTERAESLRADQKRSSKAGPARATVITYVNPAVAVALGVSVLGEPLTPAIAAAFVLILTGSVLATRSGLPVPAPDTPPTADIPLRPGYSVRTAASNRRSADGARLALRR